MSFTGQTAGGTSMLTSAAVDRLPRLGDDRRRVHVADRIIALVGYVTATVSGVLVAADLVLVFTDVISRYFFDKPYGGWADDLTVVFLVCIAFFGGTLALARDVHPQMSVVVDRLSPRSRPYVQAVRQSAILLFTISIIVAVHEELPIVQKLQSSTGIPLSWNYWPLMIAGIGMAIIALCRVIKLELKPLLASTAVLAVVFAVWWLAEQYLIGPGYNAIVPMGAAFVIAMVIGVPVGISLGIASMVYVLTSNPPLPIGFVAGRMVAGVQNIELLAVPFFVAGGVLMEEAGVFKYLLYLLRLGLGRVRGSLNVVSTVCMYIFSGCSGSRIADIAWVSKMVIPEYERQGEAPEGVALLAAGACMGETLPPSTELLIIAGLANVSVGALFMAGILPATLLAVAIIAISVIWKPVGFRDDNIPRSRRQKVIALGHALLALMLPVILIGGIVGGIATPTEVSSFAVVYGLLLALVVYRSVGVRKLLKIAVETATITGTLLFIFANATTVAWIVAVQPYPGELTSFLLRHAAHGSGTALLMFITIAVMLVMGWLMEGIAAIVILLPVFLPAAQAIGINAVQYTIVMAIAMDVGVILPPLGLLFFTACAIGGRTIEEVTPHIFKYAGVIVVGLIVIAFVPALTLWLPRVLGLL
jgi:tripartite ATP-independent transporter DctM subunit